MTKHVFRKDLASASPLGDLRRKNAPEDFDAAAMTATIEKIATGFEALKATNDERLKEIEKKGAVDPLLEEKLKKIDDDLTTATGLKSEMDKIKTAVDEISKKSNRPRAGEDDVSEEVLAHRKAFGQYLRKDEKGVDGDLAEMQLKALNLGTGEDGGFAVPENLDREIGSLLQEVSPVREYARVVVTGTSDYEKLMNVHGVSSGWVGETDGRPETNAPKIKSVKPPVGEIYAMPAATLKMLDDVFFDAEGWIAEEVQQEFAEQEGIAFISGDGADKPKGFLSYATSADKDGVRSFGTVQTLNTGAAGAFAAADPADILIDTYYSLKAGHRQNAAWMMNSETVGKVRKLKDGDGSYLWRPGLQEGQPDSILGRPLATAEDMPGVAADSLAIALANWQAAYYVVDRIGTRVLRDPYSQKPYVLFYVTKRVGGGMVDTEAMKLVKFAA